MNPDSAAVKWFIKWFWRILKKIFDIKKTNSCHVVVFWLNKYSTHPPSGTLIQIALGRVHSELSIICLTSYLK